MTDHMNAAMGGGTVSTLAEKIATHHEWTPLDRCECGGWEPRKGVGPRDFIQHVAEATLEASGPHIRAMIAQEILERLPESGPHINMTQYREGILHGMNRAIRIAKGPQQ